MDFPLISNFQLISQILPISSKYLNGANSGSGGPREEVKKENHQNLAPEIMKKSNPVQKWFIRTKTGEPYVNKKGLPRPS